MLHPELVGRSPVECTKLRYSTDVCLLAARRQVAHRHVVDHALAQRRDRFAHLWTPVNWTARTRNPDRPDASPRRALPPIRIAKAGCATYREWLCRAVFPIIEILQTIPFGAVERR